MHSRGNDKAVRENHTPHHTRKTFPQLFKSALLYHSSTSCIRKNATPKVTPTRRYLLPRTMYKIRQGTRVDDSWLARLQLVAVYVVVTTVGSGLMIIIDLNTYANSVVVAFSVVALNNKVGRSRGVAERSWHSHTHNLQPNSRDLGCFFKARFKTLPEFIPSRCVQCTWRSIRRTIIMVPAAYPKALPAK